MDTNLFDLFQIFDVLFNGIWIGKWFNTMNLFIFQTVPSKKQNLAAYLKAIHCCYNQKP